MLRTLHITNAWHPSSGGIGTFYRALLQAANKTPWHCRLVVPSPETRFEAIGQHAGIYHVAAPRAPFSPEYRVLYPQQYLPPGSPLRAILRQEQPHVFEVNDKYTLTYLAGLARVGRIPELRHRPAVVGLSCERMDETLAAYIGCSGFSRWFAKSYMKALYFPQFDHHVAVSGHVSAELETASKGHKVERGVWVRGMGVDVELFTPRRRNPGVRASITRKAGCSDQAVLLLYAGRLAPEKNLDLLLATLEWLPRDRHHLLIAGNGPSRAEFLASAMRRLPRAVSYLGHVASREELADLYANVDVFLHSNPREPFGIAPLEAMAAGVPLVAPDSGGVTTYANSSNAWLERPSGLAFAAAVRYLLRDSDERLRRVESARRTALRLSWTAVCQSYHELYRGLWERTRLHAPAGPEPAFYSTAGDWLGREILERHSPEHGEI